MAGRRSERTAGHEARVEMSRFLLDTNAVIALLRGNLQLNDEIANAEWVGISIITKLEFLSFSDITEADTSLFIAFESRVEIIDIANAQADLLHAVVKLKKETRVKLPDAIIVASALEYRARLITADTQILNQWPGQTMPIPRQLEQPGDESLDET